MPLPQSGIIKDDPSPPAAITITVTSFSAPDPTATDGSSSSTPASQRKFAGLAAGAAIGGFALTCVLGWALFLVWKRRHPNKWHGRAHPPADFGWRRATASKLQETDRSEKSNSNRLSGSSDVRFNLFIAPASVSLT